MEDVFLDAFDTMDDAPSTPRASMNGGVAAAPSRSPDIIAEEELSTSPFHDLTPQQQVASVVAEGGVLSSSAASRGPRPGTFVAWRSS